MDQYHLADRVRQRQRLLQCRVTAAHDAHRAVAQERRVAARAMADAFPEEPLLAGHAERAQPRTGGEDDRAGGDVSVAGRTCQPLPFRAPGRAPRPAGTPRPPRPPAPRRAGRARSRGRRPGTPGRPSISLMLSSSPPGVPPVSTSVDRPRRAAVRPAVSPAMPPPATMTSTSAIGGQRTRSSAAGSGIELLRCSGAMSQGGSRNGR